MFLARRVRRNSPQSDWVSHLLTHAHLLTLTRSRTRTHSLTRRLTHSRTRTHSHSLAHSLAHWPPYSLAHSPTDSLAHSPPRSLSQSLTRSLSQSLTHSKSRHFWPRELENRGRGLERSQKSYTQMILCYLAHTRTMKKLLQQIQVESGK